MPQSFIMQMKSDSRNGFRPSFGATKYFKVPTKQLFGQNEQRTKDIEKSDAPFGINISTNPYCLPFKWIIIVYYGDKIAVELLSRAKCLQWLSQIFQSLISSYSIKLEPLAMVTQKSFK